MISNFGTYLSSLPVRASGSPNPDTPAAPAFQVEAAAKQVLDYLHVNHGAGIFANVLERLSLKPEQLNEVLTFLRGAELIRVEGEGKEARISLTEYATDALRVFN